MSLLKKIIHFYVNSSIHVALAITALSVISFLKFNISIDYSILAFIFFSSITGYNFVKYAGIAKLHHQSLTKNLQLIQVFSFCCFVILLYLASLQTQKVLWATSVLGILTFFYAVPFFPNKTNLRSLRSFKIFVIALVWAGATVFLPLVNSVFILAQEVLLIFLQRFLFVIALTIPFEIRDVLFDHANLGTLPQRTSVKWTKRIGYLLIAFFLGVAFLVENSFMNIIPELLVGIIAAIYIFKASKKQGLYFSAFWVEGIPLLWLFLEFII